MIIQGLPQKVPFARSYLSLLLQKTSWILYVGIITINTVLKMEEERQIHKYKIIALLEESKERTGQGNAQIHKYKIIAITKESKKRDD